MAKEDAKRFLATLSVPLALWLAVNAPPLISKIGSMVSARSIPEKWA
jgi:hypothetical protein